MGQNMTLSVDAVIPVFNAERFIVDTVLSALAQTHALNKIIIVDDGSSDHSVDAIRRFRSPAIHLITAAHGGVSRARNIGIHESTADYIAFLDADDLWDRTRIAKAVEAATEHPDAAVIYCNETPIDEYGREITAYRSEIGSSAGDLFKAILLDGYRLGNPSALVVARKALIDVGGFDERLQFSEDVDLYVRLAERYAVAANAERLVRRRDHPYSTTKAVCRQARIVEDHLVFLSKWVHLLKHDTPAVLAAKTQLRVVLQRLGVVGGLAFFWGLHSHPNVAKVLGTDHLRGPIVFLDLICRGSLHHLANRNQAVASLRRMYRHFRAQR